MFIKNKNNRHVNNEAIVPGAYFIFPIFNRVKKNKLKKWSELINENKH